MKPNFIFIGPDKSGSSWLYNIFKAHPEIFVPEIKDIYFFDRYYDRGIDWYFSFFEAAPKECKAVGELSHDYLFSAEAAKRIRKDLPDVKIFTVLRNPVEKIWSHYLFLIRSGITKKPFEIAINEIPELIEKSLYYPNLKVYYDLFEPHQIGVFLFDDLKKDSRKFAKDIFDFLGVSYIDNLPYEEKVLPASKPRSFLVAKIVKTGANIFRQIGLETVVGKVKSNKTVQKLLYKPYKKKPKMSEETKQKLKEIVRNDIEKTSKLVNLDLSMWYR